MNIGTIIGLYMGIMVIHNLCRIIPINPPNNPNITLIVPQCPQPYEGSSVARLTRVALLQVCDA